MKNLLLLAVCLMITPAFLHAQSTEPTAGMSAPVKWERYSDKDQNISILFPKMPTAWSSSFGCSEVRVEAYYAFAEGVVYSMTIYSKQRVQHPCPKVVEFDRQLLIDRILKLDATYSSNTKGAAVEDGRKSNFRSEYFSVWILPDMSRNRWIEMAVSHRSDAKTYEKQFIDSVDLNNAQGRPIDDGAVATIGDIDSNTPEPSGADLTSTALNDPIFVLAKPKARYTDDARDRNVEGAVTLRVELLRNGSVGNIEVVKGLKYGLTEQAIAAAKKIVFLPRRTGGVPISAKMLFEYNFSIY